MEFGKGENHERELLNEVGDEVREYRAMHEENFRSSWPREEERGKEARTARAEKKEQERYEKRKRGERRKRNEDGQKMRWALFRWRLLKNLLSRRRFGELW